MSAAYTIDGKPMARLGDLVDCPQKYPGDVPQGVNTIVEGEPVTRSMVCPSPSKGTTTEGSGS